MGRPDLSVGVRFKVQQPHLAVEAAALNSGAEAEFAAADPGIPSA
jgi:hypothetical protein